MSWTWYLLLLIPLGYVGLLFLVAWFSVHPRRLPIFLSPGSLGTAQESVEIASEGDIKLAGWWVERPESEVVCLLCHGYIMNRSEPAPLAAYLYHLGLSSLLFDFRAHGKSGGNKTGLGWSEREDVRAAVLWIRERRPGAKIVIFGSSMGGAAAALAVGEEPDLADALVLDSAYSKLSEAVNGWWRFLGGKGLAAALRPTIFFSTLMVDFNPKHVDVAEALEKLKGKPILILHGDKDDLAVPADARRNLAAAGERARLVWFEGCGHSEGRWMHPARYHQELLSFLQESGFVPDSPKSSISPVADVVQ